MRIIHFEASSGVGIKNRSNELSLAQLLKLKSK